MKKYLFGLTLLLTSIGIAGALRIVTVDQFKSADLTKTWDLPAASDTLVGRASTDTLTNKTINGSLNTITNVSLTTGVTGILPIANGGTNSSSFVSGFMPYFNGTSIVDSGVTYDSATDRLFIGTNASIGGSNAGIQYSNAAVANRAQIKLHSYFAGSSIAGVSTLTSQSGTIGVNNAVVAGQEYSKWTAQAGATTVGSAPISGNWAFLANTVNALTVTSDYRIQLTNLAGTLGTRLFLGSEGALQLPNYTTGIAHFDASGNITSSAISLTADVSGVLPIANGGTNSSTALNNNRIMVSSAGAIVEAAALTNGQLLIGSTGAAPVAAAITGTANQVIVTNGAGSITLSTPQDIGTASAVQFGSVLSTGFLRSNTSLILEDPGAGTNTVTIQSGVPTASYSLTLPVDDGLAAQVLTTDGTGILTWTTPTTGTVTSVTAGTGLNVGAGPGGTITSTGTLNLADTAVTPGSYTLTNLTVDQQGRLTAASSGTVNLTTQVTGVLPIANGGTNSSTALNNNRIMVSSAGAIVEAAALTNGQLLIGSTGAAPVAAAITGTANQVIVTNGAGSITLSTPQDIGTASAVQFGSVLSTGFVRSNTSLILEDPGAGTNTLTFQAPTLAGDFTFTLPVDDGLSGQVLRTDGAGVLSWITPNAGTVTSVTAGTGLNVGAGPGGTITSTGTLNLADTAVTPGSYTLTSLTVDQQGRLTAASNGTVNLATQVTGVLPLANGGTNKNITASAGAVVYSDADSFELTAVGTTGQFLTSNGTSAPTWTTFAAASDVNSYVFSLNGPYADVIGTSANDQGDRFICQYSAGCSITSVCMYVKTKGTSGTTTLDLKRAAKATPNTFATIFSTAPAATTTITDGQYICTGDGATTGWTIPIMSPNPFLMSLNDTLRLDVTGVMAGSEDAGLIIKYQSQ